VLFREQNVLTVTVAMFYCDISGFVCLYGCPFGCLPVLVFHCPLCSLNCEVPFNFLYKDRFPMCLLECLCDTFLLIFIVNQSFVIRSRVNLLRKDHLLIDDQLFIEDHLLSICT